MSGVGGIPQRLPVAAGDSASAGDARAGRAEGTNRAASNAANLRRLDLTVADSMGRRVVAQGSMGRVALELPEPVPAGTRIGLEHPAGARPSTGTGLAIIDIDGRPPPVAQMAKVIDMRSIDTVPARPGPVVRAQLYVDGKPVAGASIDVRLQPQVAQVTGGGGTGPATATAQPAAAAERVPRPAAAPTPTASPPTAPSAPMPASVPLPSPQRPVGSSGAVIVESGASRPAAGPAAGVLSPSPTGLSMAPPLSAVSPVFPGPSTAAARQVPVADGNMRMPVPQPGPERQATAQMPSTAPATSPPAAVAASTAAISSTSMVTEQAIVLRVSGHLGDGRPVLALGPALLVVEEPIPELPEEALVGVRLVDPMQGVGIDGQGSPDDGVEALMRALMARAKTNDGSSGMRLPVDERLGQRLLDQDARLRLPAPAGSAGEEGRAHGTASAGERASIDTARPAVIDGGPDGWRGIAGMLGEHDPAVPLSQWLKEARTEDGGRDADPDRDHLALHLEFSELGRVRVDLYLDDGLLRASVVTERELPPPIRLEIADLFGAALELSGMDGQLVFRVDRRGAGQPTASAVSTRMIEI